MNKKLIFSILLVVCLLAVVSVVVFAQSSPNVRWEYTGFQGHIDKPEDLQKANQLGAEGWELIARDTSYGILMFKRRLP